MVTEGINQTKYRISLAHTYAPKDILTKVARVLVKATTWPLILLTPIEIVTTAVGGCLIGCTFGLLSIVLSLIWWLFLAPLLGSSWLWLHAWYLRPILLLPGVIVALVADLYVMLAPEPEKDAKFLKLAIADEWPLSWYLLRPPAEAELKGD
jgi:hypothetical protein